MDGPQKPVCKDGSFRLGVGNGYAPEKLEKEHRGPQILKVLAEVDEQWS